MSESERKRQEKLATGSANQIALVYGSQEQPEG